MWRFILLGTLAVQLLTILPLFVGGFAETLGLGEGELGVLAAADLAGATIACLAVTLGAERIPWRGALMVSAVVAGSANLLCLGVDDFLPLVSIRLTAGLSAGVIYALAMVAIARGDRAVRDYGWTMAGQALLATFYYIALPPLVERVGFAGLFVVLALNMYACLGLLPRLTALAGERPLDSPGTPRWEGGWAIAVVLTAIALLYVAQGGIWAFVERIGHSAGHEAGAIGQALAVSALAGLAAGIVAAVQGERLGFRLPLWLVFSGQLLALLMLWRTPAYVDYLMAVTLYNFCWTYVVPFHMGVIARYDGSGRAAAIAPAVQGLGLAAGAALAGGLINRVGGYQPLYQLAMVLGAASLGLMLLSMRNRESLTPCTEVE